MAASTALLLATSAVTALATCYEPSPAFPVPKWRESGPWIPKLAFAAFEDAIHTKIPQDILNNTSFSIEVTSGDETLWTTYHSAREHNEDRPGVTHVGGDSQYRIASVTKVFTTLGLLYQHAAGNLSLDNAVDRYVPELRNDDRGAIPWDDITLKALASQLSGIPRDFAIGNVLPPSNRKPAIDPTTIGLPPISDNITSPCPGAEIDGFCTRADLLRAVKHQEPLFAPNQKSTYSNDAFEILGLVLENATGLTYSEYITQAILEPLNMTMSSFEIPPDDNAVLPVGDSLWDIDQGVQRPTGGLYSSASDLSKFLRYVLNHYNSISTGINWLLPLSWGTGIRSSYGMPWEQFRSDRILDNSRRPVTIVSKSGGLPGYYSLIILLPEYNLGLTLLVAGKVEVLDRLVQTILVGLINAAETAIWKHIDSVYAGSFIPTKQNSDLNSSLILTASPTHGHTVSTFVSNGTDILATTIPQFLVPGLAARNVSWHAQLTPTLLYKNETSKEGEIWRMMIVEERKPEPSVLDEWCVTDVDFASYGGRPVNEVVFWLEQGRVEIPAFRITLEAAKGGDGAELKDGDGLQKVLGSGRR